MEFLSHYGIPFVEKNISEDNEARFELLRLGGRRTPTTLIGDDMVQGFDRRRIAELLGITLA